MSFSVGDSVTINSPEHRVDGQTGTVESYSPFWGWWFVTVDGTRYGFLEAELTKNA